MPQTRAKARRKPKREFWPSRPDTWKWERESMATLRYVYQAGVRHVKNLERAVQETQEAQVKAHAILWRYATGATLQQIQAAREAYSEAATNARLAAQDLKQHVEDVTYIEQKAIEYGYDIFGDKTREKDNGRTDRNWVRGNL